MHDNFLSKNNAKKLAHRIRSYWFSKGYEVTVRLEESRPGWAIKSDMVNGLPIKKASIT